MAEEKNSFCDRIAVAGVKLLDPEAVKKAIADYIDNNERLAKEFVGLQERAAAWAEETPLAPILKTQREFAAKVIETSAAYSRKLWRIEPAI